ncbi:putative Glycerol-3-phosphate O-acyltransferase [Mycena chlorophos]|uniref:Putative Glycerol-3-phosphate O-acyltransferase n=1 Tax=Mycena chlorophos TaxID=658473 RepID=A0A8H6WH05_MYCCL|nr:putative Glycerol-3-phosphate O-acyltransferase [Mycena chlorophos]KAF7318329.1 putative Glycerol-3-phosphate O-acyltransferase [Mycena chlorophos]
MLSQVELTPADAVAHPRFYLTDGNIYFLVKNIVFRLHKSILANKIGFFNDMFSMAEQTKPLDGFDHQHAINLNGADIRLDVFEFLCVFLYERDDVDQPTLDYYVALIRVAHMWNIPSAMKYATRELPLHPGFTAALKIQLARQYDIPDWFDSAFSELHATAIEDITLEDADTMGVVTLHKVLSLKFEILEFRRSIAYNPPAVSHSYTCTDNPECSKLWETFWWLGVAKQLLHKDNKHSLAQILRKADPSKGILSQMPLRCFELTVHDLVETGFNNDTLEIEAIFKSTALKELKDWVKQLGV